MEIKHEISGHKGKFYSENEFGHVLAEMTYVKAGHSKIIIDHTEVSEESRGTGIGKVLVEKAAEYARENNLKIIPLCPFAKAVMHKDTSFSDIL